MNLLPARSSADADFVGAWKVNDVYHVDALTLLRGLPAGSVNLMLTDPPYNVGKDYWDKWDTVESFLLWLDVHLSEMRRVLAPNGSLYLFAASRYGAHVELAVAKHFNVLNRITWRKKEGWHKKVRESDLRSYFSASETIIFAEKRGDDYSVLVQYLGAEIERAGVTKREIAGLFPSANGNLTGCVRNWYLGYGEPTHQHYTTIRRYLCEKTLSNEYLQREYNDLRRPFYATSDSPHTDVWDFETVYPYSGKHPAEKPLDMMNHIVRISSRSGDLVCDPFCGSGSSLLAAKRLDRQWIGGDFDAHWAAYARKRLAQPYTLPMFADSA